MARNRDNRGSRAVTALMCAVVVLAVALAALRVYPTPCDACGRRVARQRGARLVPGWRFFLPEAELGLDRPFLCPSCFQGLLRASPAKDQASREALAAYLTNPAAARAVREAMQRAPQGQAAVPLPPGDDP